MKSTAIRASSLLLILFLSLLLLSGSNGFFSSSTTITLSRTRSTSTVPTINIVSIPSTSSSSSSSSSLTTSTLFMAGGGFGASSSSKNNKNKKKDAPIKLKPKLQWDRYAALKHSKKVPVGIRLLLENKKKKTTPDDDDDENETSTPATAAASDWLEIGHIKTKDNDNIPLAVAMQRAIIAEHGKRLYPLQVPTKKMTCEWGYLDSNDGEWKVVDIQAATKDIVPEAAEGIVKSIGFEGKPDPASGFYCVYDHGKLKLGEETSFAS